MSEARPSGKGRYLLVALAVLALDQWTKWLVETHVTLHDSRELIRGVLYLSHVRNTGVAFGMFAAHGEAAFSWLISALSFCALLLVGWFFWKTPPSSRLLLVALAMVLGGAFGNLLDRVSTGAVTDFVGVYLGSYRWPDFNVADSAICVGIGLMLLDSFRAQPETSPAAGDGEA